MKPDKLASSDLILAATLFGLFFHPESGGINFLLNVRKLLPGLHHGLQLSSSLGGRAEFV
jgi:hypothetical protein